MEQPEVGRIIKKMSTHQEMCVPERNALYVSPSEQPKERRCFMERDSPVARIIKEKHGQSRNELKFSKIISPSEFIPSPSQGSDI